MFKIHEIIERSPVPGPESPTPFNTVEWEFNILLELFKSENPSKILEVGSFYGATLYHWLNIKNKDAEIVSVDINCGQPAAQVIFKSLANNSPNLILIEKDKMNYHAPIEASAYGPYDFIFFNTSVSYENAKNDWVAYAPLIKDDGIIAINNINLPGRNKINKFWREVQQLGYVTQELIANHSRAGIGIVYI